MKTSRFPFLAVSAALALGVAGSPTSVRAQAPIPAPAPDDAKRRQAAEELLKVRKTEDLVNSTVTRMGEMTDRISDNAAKQAGASVNPQEFSQKLRTEARDMIRKEFNWEALKPEFVQAYSQAFTETELKEMTAFYQSPTGKKLVAMEPEIQGRLSKLSQEKAMAVMPRVVQHLRELVAATKPPGSPPSPLAPPLPPGLTAPPSPPPGMMIPPPPPPGMMPNSPPAATTPAAPPNFTPPPPPPSMAVPPAPPTMTPPPAPSGTAAASSTPAVHPSGKSEPGTP